MMLSVKKKKRNHVRTTPVEKFFTALIYTVLAILGASCILPFIHLIALSFSGSSAVDRGVGTLFPSQFCTDA